MPACLQLGAHEDAWPIANVSKVRLATGEFYGITVPNLIFYTWFNLLLVLAIDFTQFYLANNTVRPAVSAPLKAETRLRPLLEGSASRPLQRKVYKPPQLPVFLSRFD